MPLAVRSDYGQKMSVGQVFLGGETDESETNGERISMA